MTDRVGQQLGNYRLTRLLGRGGFAEVYLGQHMRLNMQAAIKVLHTHLADEEVEGFQRESQMIAALLHPHIVRVLDFDVQQGVPFIVMDYAPQGSLETLHPRGQRLPPALILRYVRQVANALQYAHDKKHIHRDVKPANMLLHNNGTLALSDFGIATTAHNTESLRPETLGGTAAYMAPEQAQGESRPASDQYALAVCVYQWITGRLPFQGTVIEIGMQHAMKPPPSLVEQIPGLSRDVEQVVFTAMAKDPRQRFKTVREFAAALELAVQVEQDATTFKKPPNFQQGFASQKTEVASPFTRKPPAIQVVAPVHTKQPAPIPINIPPYERPARPCHLPSRLRLSLYSGE